MVYQQDLLWVQRQGKATVSICNVVKLVVHVGTVTKDQKPVRYKMKHIGCLQIWNKMWKIEEENSVYVNIAGISITVSYNNDTR